MIFLLLFPIPLFARCMLHVAVIHPHCPQPYLRRKPKMSTRSMLLNEFGMREIPNKTKERKDKKKGLSALVSLVSLLIDNFDMLAKEYLLRTPCSVLRIQRTIYP